MTNIYIAILVLFLTSCSKSQELSQTNTSFEDFQNQIEDPILKQQLSAIKKNKIRKCIISKWEHSPNNDTLELQKDKTVIYYNGYGQIDSLIDESYETKKLKYEYDDYGHLIKRIVSTNSKWTMNIQGSNAKKKSSVSTFEYDNNGILTKEIININGQDHKIEISYNWSSGRIITLKVLNEKENLSISYEMIYQEDKLIKRVISSNSTDRMKPDRTNEFVYSKGKLAEITNTWMFVLELLEQDTTMNFGEVSNSDFSDISSTKFTYDNNDRLNFHQKVYGMWPGESFWVTTYSYLNNDLIKEKEMNNDGEFGHTKIVLKYVYE